MRDILIHLMQDKLNLVNNNSINFDYLEQFFTDFTFISVEGKYFCDFFIYDEHPIWDFFKRRLIHNMLPEEITNFDKIIEIVNGTEKPATAFEILLLRKKMYYNHLSKILISRFARKKSVDKSKTNVLFQVHTNALTYINGKVSVDRIQNLVDAVNKDDSLAANLVVVDPLSHKISPNLAKHDNLLYRFTSISEMNSTRHQAKNLNKLWAGLREKIVFDDEIKQKIFNVVLPALDFFFSTEMLFIIISSYGAFKKIISEQAIKSVIVYAPNNVLDRCLVYAAHKLNVPVIIVPHGIVLAGSDWDLPHNCFFFCNGELQREAMIARGAPSTNVITTGPLILDDFNQFKKNVQKTEPIWNTTKKKIVLCTSSMVEDGVMNEEDYFAHIEKYLLALEKIKDCEVVIKPHPLEKKQEWYNEIIAKYHLTNFKLEKSQLGKEHLYNLMYDCDVFLTFFSTTIWEASLFDKPVILIDTYPIDVVDKDQLFHKDSETIIKVVEPKDVIESVKKCLYDQKFITSLKHKRKEFITRFCYLNDGKELERMIKQIKLLSEVKK